MSFNTSRPGADGEILRPSFPDIEESVRPYTMVSYGLPFEKACAKHVAGFLSAQRIYILVSKTLSETSDNLTKLQAALGDRHAGTWIGIQAHTPYDALVPILADLRAKSADCLITLGGGSLADAAKVLAYALENGAASLDDLVALEPRFLPLTEAALAGLGNPPRLKLVFIPTTLSGAEYSRWAGCTNPRTSRKVQFTHPGMFAALVVLDPALCRGTPDWVWRSTGVRAVDHCVENICSTNAQPASDAACQRGLKRLVRALLAYARDPDDLEAKLEAQLGCNDAMSGLTLLVACGASHGIGHNLGPLGVGHGQTSCVLLPSVMKYNARANLAQQAVVKRTLWSDEAGLADVLRRRGLEEESSDAGDALRAFFDELGMPRSLKDVGVGRDKWDTLAENSLHDFFLKANPVPMTKVEQVMEVLEMCSGDQ